MTAQHVFVATGDLLATYLAARDALNAHIESCIAGAKAFHPEAMPFGTRGGFSGRSRISGIVGPKDANNWQDRYKLDPAPEAWRWVQSRDCYRPRQGKPGAPAKAYLDAHEKAPRDPSFVVAEAAVLPDSVFVGNHIFWPGAWLDGDRVWIYYGARLDSDEESRRPHKPADLSPGVREARLSEFHAAREAAEAARAA